MKPALGDSHRGDELVLSLFPLPQATTARFSSSTTAMPLVALGEVGLSRGIAFLWRRKWVKVVFAVAPTDPVELKGLADLVLAVCRSEKKEYLDLESGRREDVSGRRLATSVARSLRATVAGFWAAFRNWYEAAASLRAGRRPHLPVGAGGVAYLRASVGLPMVGGSVGHTTGVIGALLRAKRHVALFAAALPAGLPAGCDFARVPPPRDLSFLHELNRHRYSREFAVTVTAQLKAREPAFIYQRYVLNDLSGVRIAKSLGRALILEYNGSEVWTQENWGRPVRFKAASRTVELACLHAADLVVTVSETLLQEVRAAGVPPERILMYPNGVELDAYDPARFSGADIVDHRLRLGVPRDACVITMVSTFGRWHGAEVLAEALYALPENLGGRRLHVLFVGDGPRATLVREILARDGNADRVTMAGVRPQEETPLTLAASDILVAPHVPNADGSPFFGSPTKLFEYMAAAKPIVASDLEQIGQVLRGWSPLGHEETAEPAAILVRPGEPNALAVAIEALARMDRTARERLGKRAREFVLRAFTWDHHVRAILVRLGAQETGRRVDS